MWWMILLLPLVVAEVAVPDYMADLYEAYNMFYEMLVVENNVPDVEEFVSLAGKYDSLKAYSIFVEAVSEQDPEFARAMVMNVLNAIEEMHLMYLARDLNAQVDVALRYIDELEAWSVVRGIPFDGEFYREILRREVNDSSWREVFDIYGYEVAYSLLSEKFYTLKEVVESAYTELACGG